MIKLLIELINLIAIVFIITVPIIKGKFRLPLTFFTVLFQSILTIYLGLNVFSDRLIQYSYPGSVITGPIAVRIDYLSAWFLIIISFSFIMGVWYGIHYIKKYDKETSVIALHVAAIILTYTALIDICLVQNSFIFLVVWEIMALSSFVTVIFESYKVKTLKAGLYYLVLSHIGVLFLTIGFLFLRIKAGSFDFNAIKTYMQTQPALTGFIIFLLFFIGFGIKAGFVPFHTWLPLAHPAAPAHISGLMSGIIIKIGIFGIIRMVLLINTSYETIGYFLLIISVITGVYGVMLAIIQHNLKRLLAYHSIENIGIIGIGIGLGCIGLAYQNQLLLLFGMGGALLHTLNHALFKSLLFYSTGNIYLSSKTVNIEKLGGLVKVIPQSAYLFLIAAIAITGIPPLNGFVSEFLIYSGLFKGFTSYTFITMILFLFGVVGLVVIGGLALICFTKAFGTVFLGNQRDQNKPYFSSEKSLSNLPLYFIAAAIVSIGFFPYFLSEYLIRVVNLFTVIEPNSIYSFTQSLSNLGQFSIIFLGILIFMFGIRYILFNKKEIDYHVTWGCGYTGNMSKMQYTASSFVRNYRKLAEPFLLIDKKKLYPTSLYPSKITHQTHAGDKIEEWLVDKPLLVIRSLLNKFAFFQNGMLQIYILYGFIFLVIALIIPVLIVKFSLIINYLNSMTW